LKQEHSLPQPGYNINIQNYAWKRVVHPQKGNAMTERKKDNKAIRLLGKQISKRGKGEKRGGYHHMYKVDFLGWVIKWVLY